MPKDENMDVRIAIVESKVDDVLGKIAELQRHVEANMATKTDIANLQRELDGLQRQLDSMRSESAGALAAAEARLQQRLESELKQFATKAEVRKDFLIFALGIITVQTAINGAMVSAVVQLFR